MGPPTQCLCLAARRTLHHILVWPAAAALGVPVTARRSGFDGRIWVAQRRLLTGASRPPPGPSWDGGGYPGEPDSLETNNDDSLAEKSAPSVDPRYTTDAALQKLGRDRLPQDHEITDPLVTIIDNGEVVGTLAPRSILARMRPGQSLRMVQPYMPADPSEDRPTPKLAMCKLVNIRDEYQRQQEIKQQRRAQAASSKVSNKCKELDVTWSIDENDLANKMRQFGRFLEKGSRVEVTINRKRGSRKEKRSSPQTMLQEAEKLISAVREAASQMGARLKGKPTGELLQNMRMLFVPKGTP